MITELHNFSVGSYVVADEWNSNFRVLANFCVLHEESITDAYNTLAFPNSDLTNILNMVRNNPNVSMAQAYEGFLVQRNKEYYVGTVPSQQQVHIVIEEGLEGEARVIFNLPALMTISAPILVTYKGVTVSPKDKTADCYVDTGFYSYYNAGTYYVIIHEQNGKAQVKLISTGV